VAVATPCEDELARVLPPGYEGAGAGAGAAPALQGSKHFVKVSLPRHGPHRPPPSLVALYLPLPPIPHFRATAEVSLPSVDHLIRIAPHRTVPHHTPLALVRTHVDLHYALLDGSASPMAVVVLLHALLHCRFPSHSTRHHRCTSLASAEVRRDTRRIRRMQVACIVVVFVHAPTSPRLTGATQASREDSVTPQQITLGGLWRRTSTATRPGHATLAATEARHADNEARLHADIECMCEQEANNSEAASNSRPRRLID
jgi:hypothetical protein